MTQIPAPRVPLINADTGLISREWFRFFNYVYEQLGAGTGYAQSSADVSYDEGGTGAVLRSVQNKLRESVSVKDFGAVGDGVTNDSASFQAALNYCKTAFLALIIPAGTYLLNTSITVSSFAGVEIIGEGINITKLRKTSAGDMLTLTNCSRGTISGIAFDGTGMSSGNGIVIDGTTSGVITIRNNQFAYFPDSGLYINGLVATQFSSLIIENNLFLTNGVTNSKPQLKANYCNDTKWIGNQFGNDGSANYAPYGAYLFSCSAGDYSNNYHWNNLVGGYYEQNNYVRYAENRWETNQRQGIQIKNSTLCSFIGNHIHTNSQASSGTYNSMEVVNFSESSFVGNLFYSFSVSLTNYNLTLDAACNSLLIDSNFFSDYTTAPVLFDATSYELKFKNNLPRQLSLDRVVGMWLPFNSKGGIAAGSTLYMGASGGSSATIFDAQTPMPLTCVATRLRILSSAAPSAGQSYTFTLMIGNTPTALVATISNTAQNIEVIGLIPLATADMISIKVVTSAGATVASFSGLLVIED